MSNRATGQASWPALVSTGVLVTIYDAARRYRTDRAARAACLTVLVEDLAGGIGADVRLVLDQDDSLVGYDNQVLIEATRATGQRALLRYEHQHAHAEPLLACPTWPARCRVRSSDWRRRIAPILASVRTV